MVPFKNVTVLVQPVVQEELADRTLGNPVLAVGWSCTGYLEHMTPGEAYAEYAVALASPAILQTEVSDWIAAAAVAQMSAPDFAAAMANAQITVTDHSGGTGALQGNVYGVQGRPTAYDDGLPADHVLWILDQKMQPL